MIAGSLCKSCGVQCGKDFEDGTQLIACAVCGGEGKVGKFRCLHCDGGFFRLSKCPRRFVGGEMSEAINLVQMCGKGDWPISGGMLDQSSSLIHLKQLLAIEVNQALQEKKPNGA